MNTRHADFQSIAHSRLSNTIAVRQKSAIGPIKINVDPLPGLMPNFRWHAPLRLSNRSRDRRQRIGIRSDADHIANRVLEVIGLHKTANRLKDRALAGSHLGVQIRQLR